MRERREACGARGRVAYGAMRVVERGAGARKARPAVRVSDSVPKSRRTDNCRTDKHSGWLRHQATGVAGSVFPLR